LSGRNFSSAAEAAKFLDPKLKDISDPFLIPQMETAVSRVWQAIKKGEKILVFGDYDVDGIVSSALLLKVLNRLGAAGPVSFLPERKDEGYGLTVTALQRCLRDQNPRLILTVDCGTCAVAAAEFLKSRNIDLIVTDHHEKGKVLPEAVAVINPVLSDNPILKMLAGVGVAFKFCHALVKYGRQKEFKQADLDLKEFLGLVALGTVADIAPLLGENRVLVHHGLRQINNAKSPGWTALKDVAALKGKMDTYQLAFMIAPRLNAAGRLDNARPALELFMTNDPRRAGLIARELDKANRERQEIEAQILEEAAREIDHYFKPHEHFGLVIGRQNWHIGVIGIVASRLAARYNRPVIVIGFDENGKGRGSGRSIAGYDLLQGLNACSAVLQEWGGHEMAAGLEIEESNYRQFQDLFNKNAAEKLKKMDLTPVRLIDSWIELDEITEDVYEALERLAPFGQDNPKPVFAARGVKITAPPRVMAGKHLRFSFSDGKGRIDAVAFNRAATAASPAHRELWDGPVDIAFQIRKNVFNGSEKLELNVMDFKKTC
jgi:single-stranded-DNA-specific exonuclease